MCTMRQLEEDYQPEMKRSSRSEDAHFTQHKEHHGGVNILYYI
jgi:hypothetical protein